MSQVSYQKKRLIITLECLISFGVLATPSIVFAQDYTFETESDLSSTQQNALTSAIAASPHKVDPQDIAINGQTHQNATNIITHQKEKEFVNQEANSLSINDIVSEATSVGSNKNLKSNPKTPPAPQETYCEDLSNLKDDKTYLTADSISGTTGLRATLKGRACIKRPEADIAADQIEYDFQSQEITAQGNAQINNGSPNVIKGDTLKYNLNTQNGQFQGAQFNIATTGATGRAQSLQTLSQNRALLRFATYTTCIPDHPDWWLKSQEILLDQNKDQVQAYGSTFYVRNTPIVTLPYFKMPMGTQRQSGLLAPTVGYSSNNGVEFDQPYYFNLAPNYDFTLTPGYQTHTGAHVAGEYRFLTKWGAGRVVGNIVPHDEDLGAKRYYRGLEFLKVGQKNTGIWKLGVSSHRVSDASYIDDFNDVQTDTAKRVLPNEWYGQYTDDNWDILARYKTHQTLQNSANTIVKPYDFEPQLSVNYKNRRKNWSTNVESEIVRYTHPDKLNNARGARYTFNPSVSYNWQKPAGFVIGKLGFWMSHYDLSYNPDPNTYKDSANRIIPMASIDSGLKFEKNGVYGNRAITHILEPRLYYLYTHYKNQNQIWNFDSSLGILNINRIYSENIFTGRDRIAQANSITGGVTSRWLNQATGAQIFSATVAQRYQFESQNVTLPTGDGQLTNRKSDLLAETEGIVFPHLYLRTHTQLNTESGRILRNEIDLTWHPAKFHTLNLGYHLNRINDPIGHQVSTSGQWSMNKLAKGLYGLGMMNYDIESKRVSESSLGIEYYKRCWILRSVWQRKIETNGTFNNGLYLQVELKGLGGLGKSPTSSLREAILGYQPLDFRFEADVYDPKIDLKEYEPFFDRNKVDKTEPKKISLLDQAKNMSEQYGKCS